MAAVVGVDVVEAAVVVGVGVVEAAAVASPRCNQLRHLGGTVGAYAGICWA